jgi:putative restriction endonuclease
MPSPVRDRFGDLTVWKRGDQRAAHKPLLILYALAELERGERWVSFREVTVLVDVTRRTAL